jgi:hypothetical protein
VLHMLRLNFKPNQGNLRPERALLHEKGLNFTYKTCAFRTKVASVWLEIVACFISEI